MSKTNKSGIINKKGIRKRSFVWTYFEIDQKNQTKCSICYKILPYNSSTSSMQSHLSIDHCINSKISKKSVRHPDFVKLVSELNKSYKMPCINTVSK